MTLTQVLKKETRKEHQALEKTLILPMKAIKSVEDYSAILKAFYGFISPLEKLIHQQVQGSGLPDMQLRRQSHWLINDIKSLGGHTDDLVLSERMPLIQKPCQAVGALYVLEGSTLGGQVIVKMLRSSLPQLTGNSLSFFNGYGARTAAMWQSFQHYLDTEVLSAEQQEELLGAARDTFYTFDKWLQSSLKKKGEY